MKRSESDETADRLCRDFTPRLRTFVELNYPNISCDTDDAVQAILEKALRRIRLFDPRYSLATWVYTIARNYCCDLVRKQTRRGRHMQVLTEPDAMESRFPGPEERVVRAWEKARLRQLFKLLPSRERQVLWLSVYEEMSFSEIACVMDMPEGTARYVKHEAKEWIRLHWEES